MMLEHYVFVLLRGDRWQNNAGAATYPDHWEGEMLYYHQVTFLAKEDGEPPDQYEVNLGGKTMFRAQISTDVPVKKGEKLSFSPNVEIKNRSL